MGHYLKLSGMTQTTVAHLLTQDLRARGYEGGEILQPHVSDHIHGNRWTLDLPGAYIRVLSIPEEEMAAAFGWTQDGRTAEPPAPRKVTVVDALKGDDTLIPEAKRHLLNQYKLLQRVQVEDAPGVVPGKSPSKSRRSAAP